VGASEYVNVIINEQASTLAVNDVFNVLGVVYLLILPLVWLIKPPFGARAPQSGH
jgi:DHA2 family multidrug resistance protein